MSFFRTGWRETQRNLDISAAVLAIAALGAGEMSDIARLIELRAARISADELRDGVLELDAAFRKMRREFEADSAQAA
jgi:hypothetical protein